MKYCSNGIFPMEGQAWDCLRKQPYTPSLVFVHTLRNKCELVPGIGKKMCLSVSIPSFVLPRPFFRENVSSEIARRKSFRKDFIYEHSPSHSWAAPCLSMGLLPFLPFSKFTTSMLALQSSLITTNFLWSPRLGASVLLITPSSWNSFSWWFPFPCKHHLSLGVSSSVPSRDRVFGVYMCTLPFPLTSFFLLPLHIQKHTRIWHTLRTLSDLLQKFTSDR